MELTMMPNADEIEFKQKFIDRYEKLTNFEAFKKASLTFPRRCIRVNTLKITVEALKQRLEKNWILEPIPWCKEGFWIEHKGEEKRRDVGNLREHALGYIYVQEASSMIPPIVLDPQPKEIVLDMCASPGSKSSQLAQYMENKGILISNDYKGIRLAPLGINMQRIGANNTIITLMQGQFFKDLEFDRILVDVPCSGTGTINKSPKTLRIWNPNVVRRLAGTQKSLLTTAFKMLKKGGTLVYSTCSNEPEEDEGVISYLLDEYPDARVEKIQLKDLKTTPPILEFENKKFRSEVKDCLRIWPQDNNTEGFFVAKIRRE